MNVRIRRLIMMAFIGAVAMLALVYGFWPKAVLVETAKASRGPFRVTIDEEGKTKVKDRFTVSAPVTGFMRRIELKAGDVVKKGDALFILEPLRSPVLDARSRAEAQAAVASAQAAVKAAIERERSAKVDADFTDDRRIRFKRLLDGGAIAKEQYDQTEAQAKQAQAVYLAAKATTDAVRSDLKRAESVVAYSADRIGIDHQETVVVRSPKSGCVLRIYRESEGAVAMGEPVVDMGDTKDMEVRVELLSADAVRIKPGTAVSFGHWGGKDTLTGKVKTIEPAGFTKMSSLGVEEQRVLVIVDMETPAQGRPNLGDGYRIEASFIVSEGQDILQIPVSALFRAGEKWAVFAAEGNRARRRIIDVGRRNGLNAEILSGIAEGAVVIAQPDDAIRDGERIRIRKTGPSY
ncbi:MAG: efflux RND transporter periplasmic adaptor subunit [Deltaproteobacteria bacterium]|nr:efflux RND transporter periplasmic adaptor subunit [Deltaproteobacteria bacterium]